MSYSRMQDPGAALSAYPYLQSPGATGYQTTNANSPPPPTGNGGRFQQYLPPSAPDHGELGEPPESDPSTIPVTHLNLEFKECFHEHESTKTIDPFYKVVELTYKYTKLFIYNFFVFIFGLPFAIIFALINGTSAFIHVWIYGPFAKIILLWTYAIVPLVVAPIKAMIRPMVDIYARVFRQIRVHLSGPVPEHCLRKQVNV